MHRAIMSRMLIGGAAVMLLLTGCSSADEADGGGITLPDIVTDSPAVRQVKNGTIKACPTSTVGEMADAFFGTPEWRDFTSTTGKTVVELEGPMEYQGVPTMAMVQFVIDPLTGFSAEYVEFNGEAQSILALSALLTKMCQAT